MDIETKFEPTNCYREDRPWLAYVNGQMLRDKRGVGRRFKTREAAEKAARR